MDYPVYMPLALNFCCYKNFVAYTICIAQSQGRQSGQISTSALTSQSWNGIFSILNWFCFQYRNAFKVKVKH